MNSSLSSTEDLSCRGTNAGEICRGSQNPPIGVVWKLRDGVSGPAQDAWLLDHGSKLQNSVTNSLLVALYCFRNKTSPLSLYT
ncbi:hypothetical protein TNCV_4942251 [Trichonephila clavipes]|nr:hypothetical protein TNCV_4942251 [Trichonephila clavipes]